MTFEELVDLAKDRTRSFPAREAGCPGHRFFNGWCAWCEAPSRDGYWSRSPVVRVADALIAAEAEVAKIKTVANDAVVSWANVADGLRSDLAVANEVAAKARIDASTTRAQLVAERRDHAKDELAAVRARHFAAERQRVVELVMNLVETLELVTVSDC